jgi:hypothetical protein
MKAIGFLALATVAQAQNCCYVETFKSIPNTDSFSLELEISDSALDTITETFAWKIKLPAGYVVMMVRDSSNAGLTCTGSAVAESSLSCNIIYKQRVSTFYTVQTPVGSSEVVSLESLSFQNDRVCEKRALCVSFNKESDEIWLLQETDVGLLGKVPNYSILLISVFGGVLFVFIVYKMFRARAVRNGKIQWRNNVDLNEGQGMRYFHQNDDILAKKEHYSWTTSLNDSAWPSSNVASDKNRQSMALSFDFEKEKKKRESGPGFPISYPDQYQKTLDQQVQSEHEVFSMYSSESERESMAERESIGASLSDRESSRSDSRMSGSSSINSRMSTASSIKPKSRFISGISSPPGGPLPDVPPIPTNIATTGVVRGGGGGAKKRSPIKKSRQ